LFSKCSMQDMISAYRGFLQKTDNQTARNVIVDFDERLVQSGNLCFSYSDCWGNLDLGSFHLCRVKQANHLVRSSRKLWHGSFPSLSRYKVSFHWSLCIINRNNLLVLHYCWNRWNHKLAKKTEIASPRVFMTSKIEKGSGMFYLLDFSLVQDRFERFSTAFKQSNSKLCSLAILVFSSSHLPSLLGFANFFLTLRAFCHDIPLFQRLH